MATWVMHLRVAEKLRDCQAIADLFENIDEKAYYVGSIAPDSGRMVGNFTYIPPKDVSHWKREDVSYQQRFLDNRAFLAGLVFHLLLFALKIHETVQYIHQTITPKHLSPYV